jgi:ribosomal protein S18 acetylase RimI-like enzyme
MRADDIPFAVRLTNGEKWGVTRADLKRLIRLNPRGCFVAYDGIRRAGMTTTTNYLRKLAWIGNVIVHRNYRGKHIGRALVEHATLHLQRTGVQHIALYCYNEHVNFYEDLGFVKDAPFVRLRRSASKAEHLREEANFQRPPSMRKLLVADRHAFGADRSELIRDVLADETAWILGTSRGVSSISYLMVKEFADECEFGPWICSDPSRDLPSKMIDQALIRIGSLPVEVGCLRGNRTAIRILKVNGFRTIREGYRMFLQKKAKIGDDNAQYALGFLDKG